MPPTEEIQDSPLKMVFQKHVLIHFYLDLGIRVKALEESVSKQSAVITNLQETDFGFEQRIGNLEGKIVGKGSFTLSDGSGH